MEQDSESSADIGQQPETGQPETPVSIDYLILDSSNPEFNNPELNNPDFNNPPDFNDPPEFSNPEFNNLPEFNNPPDFNDPPEFSNPDFNESEVLNPSDYIVPLGVTQIISQGRSIVRLRSDKTVLKYPSDPTNAEYKQSILNEAAILQHIQSDNRIVEYLGYNGPASAIKLRYYPNGTLSNYLSSHPNASITQRLDWCEQLISAVEYIHSYSVIHCDICLDNILLNSRFRVVLADFQSILIARDSIMIDAKAYERPKSYMPRNSRYKLEMGFKTDLFALGSAIYHIVNGFEVFPELCNSVDYLEIQQRFRMGMFPGSDYIASHIVEKCWKGEYTTATEVAIDMTCLQDIGHRVVAEVVLEDSVDCTEQ